MAKKSASIIFQYSVYEDEKKALEKQLKCTANAYTSAQWETRGAVDPVDVVVFSPGGGSGLSGSAGFIIQKAIESQTKHAAMTFNGIITSVDVSTGESLDVLVEKMTADYHSICNERHEAYLKSPEYAKQKRKEEAEMAKNVKIEQKFFEQAMDALNDKSVDADSSPVLFKALGKWIEVADYTGIAKVGVHREQIIQALAERGFQEGEGVGDKDVKEKKDPVAYGRYCVGQLISMASKSGAVHPLLGEWMVSHADSTELLMIHEQRQLERQLADPANTKLTAAKGKSLRV